MSYDGVIPFEIQAGREGLYGLRNLVPVGGLIALRNASLEDHSWRTGGGATKLGSAIGAVTIRQAIDYWPDATTQRTVVYTSDGKIQKDDGSGGSWTELKTGLSDSGTPFLTIGGAEQAGNNRKVFFCNGVNIVQVLSGDGASTTNLSAPPADWASTNQPRALAIHAGYLWGGGNANSPHRVYRSLNTNHEDFTTTGYSLLVGPEPGEQYIACLLSYKSGLLVFKYPHGVYFVNTADPSPEAWGVYKVGIPGAAGPRCAVQVEDDVVWVSPQGTFHLVSATDVTGSVKAGDLSVRKLGSYFRDNANIAQLATAQFVYYSHKFAVKLACHGQGQTAKNRCLDIDLGRRQDVGERWIWWDRDRNETLFLRKKSEILIPAMGDNAGQIWELDQTTRNQQGVAYNFEWWTDEIDLAEAAPTLRGKYKNLRYLQLEYDPRTAATHTIDVYRDGNLSQSIAFSLLAGGLTLPFTLPATLLPEGQQLSRPRRLLGRCRRLSLRGRSSGLNEDVSITRLIVGVEAGE